MLILSAAVLIGCGAFAIFQAATGNFLPHDAAYLGMSARDLCTFQDCRILRFMIHDRVSFGGVLIAIGVIYTWLVLFPLRRKESWAWWALVASSAAVTRVFVPQDLEFMGMTHAAVGAIHSHLVPLIAHPRAGFGGALLSFGLAMLACVRYARPSLALWQALAIAGAAGFGAAIGVHPAIGYLSVTHLAPAVLGGLVYAGGLALTAMGSRRRATALVSEMGR